MFYLIALDKEFNMITPLAPTNIQWSRKYHEPGSFSIQLPLDQYSADMKYLYTKDRPEVGKITQKNYAEENGFAYMQLSGYFLENELNRHVVYPKGTTNITNSPSWTSASGKAEEVAHKFFDGFKRIKTDTIDSVLNISKAPPLSRGKDAVHTRNGEYLGAKIYDILKPSGMSYKIVYDLLANTKTFTVWTGKDLTQANTEGNNPVVFSTRYGNLRNPNLLEDETDHKNVCIDVYEKDDKYTVRAIANEENAAEYAFIYETTSESKEENATEAEFIKLLDAEASNILLNYKKTQNIEFDADAGSYVYMQDFDLGDKCDLEIAGVLQMEARLIACYEVIKSGEWSMTMEFGTPIVKKGGKY